MYEPGIWQLSRTGFPSGAPPPGLPDDYLRAMELLGPGEGPIGASYLRLYPVEELAALNEAYAVSEFYPGLLLFGSTGGGEAYGFESPPAFSIVRVPFVPLERSFAESVAPSFTSFLDTLNNSGAGPPGINQALIGLEVHEINPILFGGDPADENNKAYVRPTDHAAVCIFWNRLYRRLKSEHAGGV